MRVAWGSHVGGSLMLAAPKLMARNKPWGGLRVALEWLRGGPSAGRQMGEQSDQEAADGPRQADASRRSLPLFWGIRQKPGILCEIAGITRVPARMGPHSWLPGPGGPGGRSQVGEGPTGRHFLTESWAFPNPQN